MAADVTALERQWLLERSPNASPQVPLNELKRAYYITRIGGASADVRYLQDLEKQWLRKVISDQGVTPQNTRHIEDLWKQVVAAIGLTPANYLTENKIKFYTSPTAALQAEILSLSGLAGYWPLNDTTGDAIDRSSAGNDGTVTNATQNASGLVGRAYSFDGTGDDVTFTGLTISTTAHSIGMLYKRNGAQDTNDRLFDWQDAGPEDGVTFNHPAGGDSVTYGGSNGASSVLSINSGTLTDDTWYLLVGTYEVNSGKFYINGSQVGITDTSVTISTAAATPTLGKRAVSAANFFAGSVQHLFVFDRVLTSTEILKIAQIAGLA